MIQHHISILIFVCFSSFAFAHENRFAEDDFIPEDVPVFEHSQLYSTPDPEAVPREGETQVDVDRRLGPWLDLRGGGIAVGVPQGVSGTYGSLKSGTLIPEKGEGFKRIGGASGNWSTGMMASLLENSAAAIFRKYGIVVGIGGIAREFGGFFLPHKSHQNGLDADVLFIGTANWNSVLDKNKTVTDRFNKEKNWEYWQTLVAQKYASNGKVDSIVSMILVAPEIKTFLCGWANQTGMLSDPLNREVMRRIRPTAGHDDHFHVRLRCSPYHLECGKSFGPSKETGC